MKELLDLLEERVSSLMDEVHALRQENAQLRRDMTEKTAPLVEQNSVLQEALDQERNTREAAAKRLDALLQRLNEHMPD